MDPTNESLEDDPNREFQDCHKVSGKLWKRAQCVVAGGTSHDAWTLTPFPLFAVRTDGPFKFDADGNRFIDFWMGHGALLMGHGYPPVVQAITEQVRSGTHFAAPHELEVRWAEQVTRLVPSAKRVRFVSSGTEGTLLALRIARAFTGRHLVIKFDGHFHGWHDESLGYFVDAAEGGLNEGALTGVSVFSPSNPGPALNLISLGEVAAVILEPGGGGSGALPCDLDLLRQLRRATSQHGSLLIFDEVVSGFRYAPGGAQQLCGVVPDVTVLAKILAGGLPGGAVAGREEVMAVFGVGTCVGGRRARVRHSGTFNANPLSAAAGMAMLSHAETGQPQAVAQRAAEHLVRQVNDRAASHRIDIRLYNQSSIFHVLIGACSAGFSVGPSTAAVALYAQHPDRYEKLRRAMLFEGVDTHPVHGWVSAVHNDDVIADTVAAFDRAFAALRATPGFEDGLS